MPTLIYLITSITKSGGSDNYDYILDLDANFNGTFTFGPGVTNDGDETFEGGEQLFYTIGDTVYIASYAGFVDVNGTSSQDFGVVTIDSVFSVNGDENDTTDTFGIVGSQFGFTDNNIVPSDSNRATLPDPTIGTQIPGLICFAQGTKLATPSGPQTIESIAIGDLVETLDHGAQKVCWIGSRGLGIADLLINPKLRPIRIKAGTLGHDTPHHDLLVSPQHRIFVRSKIAMRMFNQPEIFVIAKHLLDLPGVEIAHDIMSVTYYHIMCDTHEIVHADGAWAETLYTGPEAIKTLTPEAIAEIETLFGDIFEIAPRLARHSPAGKRAKQLVSRHIKNAHAIVASQTEVQPVSRHRCCLTF